MIQHFFKTENLEILDLGDGVKRQVLAYADNLMTIHVYFEEGAEGKPHHHPHEQITYVLKGKFEFTVGDEKRVVTAGDTIYKEPNIVHGAICLEAGELLDIFTPMREDFI
ncbi:cupin domain-containing protein [Carnobacterium gallinarum]|uniref:cupin domain-containing protein n=1 Tax=Carnobacterium gallinarum TaxID=2749 RepID=UPI000552CBFF|nr:cupin domain-containing protein [Carnobacterium gallinarum]